MDLISIMEIRKSSIMSIMDLMSMMEIGKYSIMSIMPIMAVINKSPLWT